MDLHYDRVERDILILAADGGLNTSQTAEALGRDLEKLIDAGLTRIIIDCRRLEFINSFGLGVLIRLRKRLAGRGGQVKIAAVPGTIARLLHDTRVQALFAMYPDVDQARAAFQGPEHEDAVTP